MFFGRVLCVIVIYLFIYLFMLAVQDSSKRLFNRLKFTSGQFNMPSADAEYDK